MIPIYRFSEKNASKIDEICYTSLSPYLGTVIQWLAGKWVAFDVPSLDQVGDIDTSPWIMTLVFPSHILIR